MEYRRLGQAGLKLSALSYGSWVTFSFQLDRAAARELMARAFDAGVNFFDNAEVYAAGAAETMMGQVLRELGWSRDSFCVSSKVYWGGDLPTQRGLHRKHVHEACHAALRRLQVDHLDLFFCHRPDLETPIEETVRTMHDLVQQYGLTPPTMEQPQDNMLRRDRFEREYQPLYDEIGLGTTIWSPLASGVLTGKYTDGIPAGSRLTLPDYRWLRERFESEQGRAQIARAAELQRLAEELGVPLAQLAIAWCLKNPNVSTVILGASSVGQLEQNLAALETVSALTDDVMERIEAVLQNRPQLPEQF